MLADIDGPALSATASEVGATAVVTDVASPDDNGALADVAGPTRLLCLNAGVTGSHLGPVWLTPPDQWARVMGCLLTAARRERRRDSRSASVWQAALSDHHLNTAWVRPGWCAPVRRHSFSI